MRLNRYVTKDGRLLRCGYTTGTCAAAAAKAAALWLLTGAAPQTITLWVPAGLPVTLDVRTVARDGDAACCAVQKDSGDDPDVTHGIWVYASVSRAAEGVSIDGGEGIGRVTKPGLDQPVGAAAINSIPRQMITDAVKAVSDTAGYAGGLSVVISIPAGAALAQKTFNPRMGIEGGISVIGTTGIVEPMSDGALVETIRAELSMRKASGKRFAVIAPGNYGEDFLRTAFGIGSGTVIQCSNFIGDTLEMAASMEYAGLLLVGHLGKLVKLAGGMLNTHSRYGDCRMALLCAHAAIAGLTPQDATALMDAATVDEGLRILDAVGIREQTLHGILAAAHAHVRRKAGAMQTGIVLFTNTYGLLAQTAETDALLDHVREEEGQ